MELSGIARAAATEVARIKAEGNIETGFASDASGMLEQVALSLTESAEKGYRVAEIEIEGIYSDFSREMNSVVNEIKLGESMEYVLGRDVAWYYQRNSIDRNEM